MKLTLFGENYEGTSDSYYSLGITQYEMGDFRLAQRSHQHVLDIRLNLFGKDHVKTADSYRELQHQPTRMITTQLCNFADVPGYYSKTALFLRYLHKNK